MRLHCDACVRASTLMRAICAWTAFDCALTRAPRRRQVDEQYEGLALPPGVSKQLVGGRRMHVRVTFQPHPSRLITGALPLRPLVARCI